MKAQRQWFPLIFHLLLWTVWIGLPIINAGDNERFRLFSLWMIPVSLTNIPLFLINSEWLIPRIYRQKGVAAYLFSLILLAAAFSVLQYFMKDWIIPDELRFHRLAVFWTVVPVIFVLAISTGYGFIMELNKQEKIRQEEQQERLKSELSFLRSQISPHFIFNILNSIVYLIRSKSELAETVTIKLSELMRYMLYTSEAGQVPLHTELEYLKNYIALQKIRFGEDVDIQFNIEGAEAGQHIEPMLMIPFVENAFKHGVGMIEQAKIDIFIKFDETSLVFLVTNKLSPQASEDKDASSGIGIRNVKRRLELLYPDRHQLDIRQEQGLFRVELRLLFSTDKTRKTSFKHTFA
ncbi:MAG: histidine kinase [Bacteroidetes bacterium]|nr:MAG: histidine kinase [Bacteroidota bacterium]